MSHVDAPAHKNGTITRYRAASGDLVICVALFLIVLTLVGKAVAGVSEQEHSHTRTQEALYVTSPARDTPGRDIFRIEFARGLGSASWQETRSGKKWCLKNLTHTARQFECDPAVSPDGKQVAFAVLGDPKTGNSGIHVMAADGSHRRHLTPHGMIACAPSWSPKGDRIAFSRVRWPKQGAPQWDVCLIDADGKNLTSLCPGWRPQWSPDGTRLLFTGFDTEEKVRLCVVDIAHNAIQNLRYLTKAKTGLALYAPTGAWSPNGKQIAYTDANDQKMAPSNIFVMNADGSGQRLLVRSERIIDYAPQWSRDGRYVLFTRNGEMGESSDAQTGVWIVSATGQASPAHPLLLGNISNSNSVGVEFISFGGYGKTQQ